MASERTDGPTDGKRIDTGGQGLQTQPAARRGRTAAQQRQERTSDPDVLVAEIEATREDLAVTLDAIADRVSPKRVVKRGTERVKEAATSAREVVTEKAAVAREVVTEKAGVARDVVTEKAAVARSAIEERTGGHAAPAAVLDAGPLLDTGPAGAGVLPATTGVPVPRLAPARVTAPHRSGVSGVPIEAFVGAVAALVALWLLSRLRRR